MEKITPAARREFSFPGPVDVHGEHGDEHNKKENDERQPALQSNQTVEAAVSAANSRERVACPPWWASHLDCDRGGVRRWRSVARRRAVLRAEGWEKRNFIFFEMSAFKILRKKKPIKSTVDNDMNIPADDRISGTRDFTNQFVLFPARSGRENRVEEPASRISREQLNAFSNAESDNARSAHFSILPAEPPAATPEKGLAAGVLKQAAHDLRRFRAATRGVKRELYLDAYSWITDNDFSWPYSFVNVCKLLDVCPEVVRTELFADASLSWFDYWTKQAGQVSRRLQSSFVRVFANCRNPGGTEAGQLASSI
jgi:hypothetical protein